MHIPIHEKYLFSRESVREILEDVNKQKNIPKKIVLDFSEVHFMNRSFTDELLNVARDLQTEGVEVEFQNVSPDLKKMLDLVYKTKMAIQKAIA